MQFMQLQRKKTMREEGGRCLVEKLGCILQNEIEGVFVEPERRHGPTRRDVSRNS